MSDKKFEQIDTIETLAGAKIQHGQLNRRIYLMHIGRAAPQELAPALIELAMENGYTKIFTKVPKSKSRHFIEQDYRREAEVPQFYNGNEDALFLGYYMDANRREENDPDLAQEIIDLALEKQDEAKKDIALPEKALIYKCGPEDVKEMADLYRTVFRSYPFPIVRPDYLLETMAASVEYFGVKKEGSLIALASAEMDKGNRNVEMTDFATLPKWRNHNLAALLLKRMEKAMASRRMLTSYTIARAMSPGVNIVFARFGYKYGGRLINNTNIAGSIESMNVWYKALAEK